MRAGGEHVSVPKRGERDAVDEPGRTLKLLLLRFKAHLDASMQGKYCKLYVCVGWNEDGR